MSVILGEFPKNEKVNDWLQKDTLSNWQRKNSGQLLLTGKVMMISELILKT